MESGVLRALAGENEVNSRILFFFFRAGVNMFKQQIEGERGEEGKLGQNKEKETIEVYGYERQQRKCCMLIVEKRQTDIAFRNEIQIITYQVNTRWAVDLSF